jgi:twitching motility protein PilT
MLLDHANQTFDQCILRHFQEGLVTEETALAYASHKSVARRGIDDLKKKQGVMTSDITDLSIDAEYGKEAVGQKAR